MDFLVHHMLSSSAARFPDEEALVHRNERLSYRAVERDVGRLALGLRQAGCRRGDRIGIFLKPSVSQALAIFAVSKAGGAFVPLHHSLFPRQIAHVVNDCRMRGLITERSLAQHVLSAVEGSPSLKFLVLDEPLEQTDLPTHLLPQFRRLTVPETWAEQAIEKDLAAILYTSGSTGKPKGIMLSHASIMAGASIVSNYLGIRSTDRLLAALPFTFDAGLNQLTTAFQQGGTLVLISFVMASEISQLLHKERITGLAGVPTLWSLLASNRAFRNSSFPDLRYITNTGGAMPQGALADLRAALPQTRIFLMYGLTEAFRSTYLPPEELPRRPTSIGKAIPNTEIVVINDRGEPCGPGETGELVHHGPTVALGYWGNPDASAKVFRSHPFPGHAPGDPRVCYSGDLVRTDEDGYLYFVGRRDKLIKSSGFRISPTEVEEVLLESEMLREAAVVGVPDELLGQKIKAFVVPRAETTVEHAELQEFCRAKLPDYMVPQLFESLSALPKTPNGKVDYEALRSPHPADPGPGTQASPDLG